MLPLQKSNNIETLVKEYEHIMEFTRKASACSTSLPLTIFSASFFVPSLDSHYLMSHLLSPHAPSIISSLSRTHTRTHTFYLVYFLRTLQLRFIALTYHPSSVSFHLFLALSSSLCPTYTLQLHYVSFPASFRPQIIFINVH